MYGVACDVDVMERMLKPLSTALALCEEDMQILISLSSLGSSAI